MDATIDLHPGPAASFEQPFEMLDACHRRVERSLSLLERLAAHMSLHGADEQAQRAAHDVLRYFDIAAPQHHEDEERHLLPRLREHGRADLADRVISEHRAMAAAWGCVREALLAIAHAHADAGARANAKVDSGWDDFIRLYGAHIALEERDVFPLVREMIGADGLRAMGAEMARRRNPNTRSSADRFG
jgi:hemerythrin-like domain-containing protein